MTCAKFSVTLIDKKVKLYKCTNEDYLIIKRLNMPSDMFMSITNIQNEVTFICYVDENNENNENNNILNRLCTCDPRKYVIINIHEDLPGIDHIGIISTISSLFTLYNIPILYINTYSYNLILVSDEFYEKALDILKEICYFS